MNPPEPQPARRRGRKNRAFHDLLAGLARCSLCAGFHALQLAVGNRGSQRGNHTLFPAPCRKRQQRL